MSNEVIEELLNRAIGKATENQSQIWEKLAGDIEAFFERNFNELGEELRERYASAKDSGWKGEIKLSIPLIKHLGLDLGIKKEIKPETIAEKVRSLLHEDIITLGILNGTSRTRA